MKLSKQASSLNYSSEGRARVGISSQFKRGAGFILTAAMASVSTLSVAAESDANGFALEEIVVTAEKRTSTIQETPITINAFNDEALRNIGATDIAGLANSVPGLHIGADGADLSIGLRGITSFEGGARGEASVAFHLDGVYIARPYAFGSVFYDMERVEVLSGPQGTLYGRNATGGLINLISNKPKDQFEASVDVGVGDYNQFSTEAMINIPVSDQLAVRGAFYKNEHDGYIDNVLVEDGDDADDIAMRLSALYTPTENLSILVTGDFSKAEGVGGVERGRSAGGSRDEFALDAEGSRDDEFWGVRFELNWDIGSTTLTYLGSYRENDVEQFYDVDGTAADITTYFFPSETEETSHELRLVSNGEGALRWILGAYYYEELQESNAIGRVPPFGPPPGAYQQFRYTDEAGGGYDAESTAFFGQVSYDLSDDLTLHVGLRNTTDDKERIGQVEFRGLPVPGPLFFPPRLESAQDEWNKTNWKLGLDWNVTEDSLVYLSASTGYKAGGYNNGFNGSTYKPEEILAYELGTKNRFLNDRWQVNGAVFYYDYTDLQIAQQEGTATNVRNAGEADIFGIELSVLGLVTDRDRVELNIGYLDTEYKKTAFPDGGANVDVSGNQLVKAPEWSIGWAYAHDWNFSDGSVLTGRIQSSYRSETHLQIFNRPEDTQDALTSTDLLMTYTSSDERWYVQGYVRNLEDEMAFDSFALTVVGPDVAEGYGPPRTYGVKFGYSWD